MAETFHTPFGDIDPAAAEAATAAAEQASGRKDIEEITIKFAKGLCSEPFMSKSGKEYVRIQIPNSDPSDLATYGRDAKSLLEQLQSQDQRLFLVTFLILTTGKTKQELDNNILQVKSIAQKYSCNITRLDYEQEQGLINVTTSTGTKQFLTLTSREGNFYYLIIDYDNDGNQNVHFLNQVDERDLIGLMDEDEAKELEEQLAAKKAEEDAKKAALETPVTQTAEPDPEPAPEPEKYFEIAGYEIPQKTFVAVIGLALIALICLVGFIVLTKKKKAETKKPDPDADYDEDYGDEIDIPEDTMDDDDFDE